METHSDSLHESTPWRGSIYAKMLTIGLLLFILQIPIACIQGVISERIQTKTEAETFVSQLSGRNQTIVAPVLSVPYIYRYQDEQHRERSYRAHAEVLPDSLHISSDVQVEKRHRGIFEFPVYTTVLTIEGSFAPTAIKPGEVSEQDLLWNDAKINLGITDPRTIREAGSFDFDGTLIEAEPGVEATALSTSGIHYTPATQGAAITASAHKFKTTITLGGSQSLSFLPVGRSTEVSMSSPWENPSFMGNYLPVTRDIHNKGFTATWKILDLGRSFPRTLYSSNHGESQSQVLENSQFGVGFYAPVDTHRMSDRALKYEIFVIALTFLVFAMFEVFSKVRVHSIQYLLVGAALVLFYLLLLSLSEHLGFSLAYVLASLTVLGLVCGYSRSILRKGSGASTVGLSLSLLYGFFYTLLQEQDYSLLIGTLGLTLILGFLMYLTRNIDWYRLGERELDTQTV